MPKTSPPSRRNTVKGFVIGRNAFRKISAIDDIRLTPEIVDDFDEFDRRGLSAKERRDAIVRKYGQGGGN